MPEFPVTITDYDGDTVQVGVTPTGKVTIYTPDAGVFLDAEQREEFAQAWAAACHEADRQAGAVT